MVIYIYLYIFLATRLISDPFVFVFLALKEKSKKVYQGTVYLELASLLMDAMDTNGDGHVSLEEWENFNWSNIPESLKGSLERRAGRLPLRLSGSWIAKPMPHSYFVFPIQRSCEGVLVIEDGEHVAGKLKETLAGGEQRVWNFVSRESQMHSNWKLEAKLKGEGSHSNEEMILKGQFSLSNGDKQLHMVGDAVVGGESGIFKFSSWKHDD